MAPPLAVTALPDRLSHVSGRERISSSKYGLRSFNDHQTIGTNVLRLTTKMLAEVDERPSHVSQTPLGLELISARHMDTKHSSPGTLILGGRLCTQTMPICI